MCLPFESLFTITATMWPLFRMRWQMTLQRLRRSKPLSTQGTLAFGRIRVSIATMILQRRVCKIRRSAQVANVCSLDFRVKLNMTLQVGFQSETILTYVALEKVVLFVHSDYVLIQSVF